MPYRFKLARRLSRHRIAGVRLTMFGVFALLAAGCNDNDPLATDVTEPLALADSAVAPADSTIVTISDSAALAEDGVDLRLAAAVTGTDILPGQDIQAKVNSAPGGTTFTLKAGVHRMQSVIPKAGDKFIGEAGAIMNGSRRLTTFTRQGSYWVASGQTQKGPVLASATAACLADSPRCAYPEQLFINGNLLKHMGSLSGVGPGRWYFDYAADKIYFADDPTGKTVETSVSAFAFRGGGNTVTISGLIIEKYASPPQHGAIEAAGRTGWIVSNNEVRWNHGRNISTGSGMRVTGNKVHHAGNLGIAGGGNNVLVENNEIYNNNTAGFGPARWEAGAVKFAANNGLTVRGNFVHHNHGSGLWADVNAINTLFENNRVEDNDWRGMLYEISYKGIIRNNTFRRNGFVLPLTHAHVVDGAAIVVSNSRDLEIYGNIIEGNKNGIGLIQTNRGSGTYGAHLVANINAHDNTITQQTGRASGAVQNVGTNAVFNSQNNRFVHNTYDLGATARQFTWMNGDRTTAEWKGYGQDMTGTFR